jgi:hypothetical protein
MNDATACSGPMAGRARGHAEFVRRIPVDASGARPHVLLPLAEAAREHHAACM